MSQRGMIDPGMISLNIPPIVYPIPDASASSSHFPTNINQDTENYLENNIDTASPFHSVTSMLRSHVSQVLKDKIWNRELVYKQWLL